MEIENKTFEDQKMNESEVLELKAYTEPKIRKLGAMQKVTLGGSPGSGDSGQGQGQGSTYDPLSIP